MTMRVGGFVFLSSTLQIGGWSPTQYYIYNIYIYIRGLKPPARPFFASSKPNSFAPGISCPCEVLSAGFLPESQDLLLVTKGNITSFKDGATNGRELGVHAMGSMRMMLVMMLVMVIIFYSSCSFPFIPFQIYVLQSNKPFAARCNSQKMDGANNNRTMRSKCSATWSVCFSLMTYI